MKLITIDGLDGSGKATQTELLCKALNCRKVSFPDYASDSSALVRMYLGGQFGSEPGDVNAYAASAFFAVDRYASYKRDWYSEDIVVADRYTTANAVHQCCKLPREQWDAFPEWLFDFEYRRLGIPEPSAVIYLRVDPEVSQRLMTQRYSGEEAKKDIHEKNLAYLASARQAADYCSRKLGWHIVECCENGSMRPVEDIHRDILTIVNKII